MEKPSEEASPEPTAGDRENAARRQVIADRMRAEFEYCLGLSLEALGPGWTPWMKLTLIESDYRRQGDPVVGASVYKVYQGEKRLTEHSVYLMEQGGEVIQASSPEELLGDVLREKHPNHGFEHKGDWVAFDRWTLTWSSLELYEPMSPERLAALRETRQRRKKERDDAKWAEEHPLLVYAGYKPEDFPPISKKFRCG